MKKLIFPTLILFILLVISVETINLRHDLPQGWEKWTKQEWDEFLHKHAPKKWDQELSMFENTEKEAEKESEKVKED